MYYSFNENFIGYSVSERDQLWYHGKDSPDNFKINLEKLGPEWYYADKSITYKRNSLGHREKEFLDLDLENYALCIGCSITEGIALELENRYSNLLEKDLSIDVYNLGLGGTGNDVIVYNLLTWLASVPKKPKFIVIQWADVNRFITQPIPNSLKLNGVWDNSESVSRFITHGDELNYFNTKSILQRNIVKSIVGSIPTIELLYASGLFFEPKQGDLIVLNKRGLDLGRDLVHPGILTHRKWAYQIIEKVKKLSS